MSTDRKPQRNVTARDLGLHTPGPWHRNIKPASKYPVIFAGRNMHVAVVDTHLETEDEIESNCNLIAAAPELLDALRTLYRAAFDHLTNAPGCGDALERRPSEPSGKPLVCLYCERRWWRWEKPKQKRRE